ncbi:hypothetical protein ACN38_g3434 [Penicillium nordicum]|uniref:Uncharacterized protein n=1 Tax=Penicillium nordicum TaxID=229535 RepID=A0A0M9WHY9_9EURO|nr:hypothetical protein ACN38_g3434 [Penicillium nordicum]
MPPRVEYQYCRVTQTFQLLYETWLGRFAFHAGNIGNDKYQPQAIFGSGVSNRRRLNNSGWPPGHSTQGSLVPKCNVLSLQARRNGMF